MSWLLQLDISYVEAAHILVGALEAPGDVLIHGAVVQVQALGWKQGSEHQHPDTWGPCPQPPPEGTPPPLTQLPHPVATLHSLHKGFHLHIHPRHPTRASHSAIVSVGVCGVGASVSGGR